MKSTRFALSAGSCGWRATLLGAALAVFGSSVSAHELSDHPRIFVDRAGITNLAEKARGPLAAEYALIKTEADRACRDGIRSSKSRYRTPVEQICLGIAYLVERELGRDSAGYAEAIRAHWKDGRLLSPDGSGHFGYHALVYDWIYDAMTPNTNTPD